MKADEHLKSLTEWYESTIDYERCISPVTEEEFLDQLYFMKQPCCYVLYNPSNQLYKIGITKDISVRIRQLSCSTGNPIHIVLYVSPEKGMDENEKEIERLLHIYYKNKRKVGEWFLLDAFDLLSIQHLFWKSIFGVHIEDNVEEHIEQYLNKHKT